MTPIWVQRARNRNLPTAAVNGEARNGPRCPDCGRFWRRDEVEEAYAHVRDGCPEKPWPVR